MRTRGSRAECRAEGDGAAGDHAEELNAPAANSIDFGLAQRANIASRLISLRNAGSPLASLADPYSLYATTGGASGDEAMGGKLGLFINGNLGNGDKDETDFEAAYDFELTGVTVGVDYRFTDSMIGGVAVGYATSDTDFDTGGSLDADGVTGSIFGSWYGERAHVDLIAGYGSQSLDSVRRVTYTLAEEPTPIDHTATGDTDSDVTSAGRAPVRWSGRLARAPTARYYSIIHRFAEHGDDPTGFDIGPRIAAAALGSSRRTPRRHVVASRHRARDAGLGTGERPADLLHPLRRRCVQDRATAAVTSDDADDSFVLWAVGISAAL